HAVMVRSRIAHGTLRGIDAAEARALPGVVAIYTAADLAAYGPIKPMQTVPMKDGSPMRAPPRPALPAEHVRFLGEVVAYVVAETASQAKDAAEAVVLDIEPLPAVTTPPEAPGNVCLDFHYGDGAAVAAAFARAAHVTTLKLVSNRIVVNAMEPRSALAGYDPKSERFTLQLGCQGVFGLRNQLKDILKTA